MNRFQSTPIHRFLVALSLLAEVLVLAATLSGVSGCSGEPTAGATQGATQTGQAGVSTSRRMPPGPRR